MVKVLHPRSETIQPNDWGEATKVQMIKIMSKQTKQSLTSERWLAINSEVLELSNGFIHWY